MKKINYAGFLLAITTITVITSCKKSEHHDDPEPESVKIEIFTPQPGQQYEVGDTVMIKARITAPAPLHGYDLSVIRLADTTEMLAADVDVHSQDIPITAYFVNKGEKHSDMVLEIIANIDHSGNKASKKVQFHCHEH